MPISPEMATIAAQGIGSLGQVVGSLMGNGASSNYVQQVGLMDYANWYNEPINQKNRLIKAGLNPALMYQTMPQNVSETQSAQMNNYKAENMMAASSNIAQMMQGMVNASVMNDSIRAKTALDLQTLENNKTRQPLENEKLDLDNIIQSWRANYAPLLASNESQKLNYDVKILMKNFEFMDTNQRLFVKEKFAKLGEIASSIKNMDSLTKKNYIELERLKILSEIDSLEKTYRSKGLSFHDNIVFRDTKNFFIEMLDAVTHVRGSSRIISNYNKKAVRR